MCSGAVDPHHIFIFLSFAAKASLRIDLSGISKALAGSVGKLATDVLQAAQGLADRAYAVLDTLAFTLDSVNTTLTE